MIFDLLSNVVSWFGSFIGFLDSCTIAGIGSLLIVIVVTMVSGIIVKSFISRGAHA